jgi:hypothetical protein
MIGPGGLLLVVPHLFAVLGVFDWLVIMIGPGGLLLVVPHLFAVLVVPVSWVWLQKSK